MARCWKSHGAAKTRLPLKMALKDSFCKTEIKSRSLVKLMAKTITLALVNAVVKSSLVNLLNN